MASTIDESHLTSMQEEQFPLDYKRIWGAFNDECHQRYGESIHRSSWAHHLFVGETIYVAARLADDETIDIQENGKEGGQLSAKEYKSPQRLVLDVQGRDKCEPVLHDSFARDINQCIEEEDLPRFIEEFIEIGGSREILEKISGRTIDITVNPWSHLSENEIIDRLTNDSGVSEVTLAALSESSNWQIKLLIACHEKTPEHVIKKLRADADDGFFDEDELKQRVLCAIQERSSGLSCAWCSMTDKDRVLAFLQDRNINIEVLQALSKSWNPKSRILVAKYEETPEDILDDLRNDPDSNVSSSLRERDLPYSYRYMEWEERCEVLAKGDISQDEITRIWQGSDYWERRFIPWSPACTDGVISQLLQNAPEDEDLMLASLIPYSSRRFERNELLKVVRTSQMEEASYIYIASAYGIPDFKMAIALSRYLPSRAQAILERSQDAYVLDALKTRELSLGNEIIEAGFPGSLIEVINNKTESQRLSEDDWRKLARFTIREKPDRLGTGKIVEAALVGDNTPNWLIDEISQDKEHPSRHLVAFRELPDELRYAGDEHHRYLEVLNMKSIETEILKILSIDESEYMQEAIGNFLPPPEGVAGIPEDFKASERPNEIRIAKMMSMELGKANWNCDDIDEESEFREYTLPSIVVCVGLDFSGDACSVVKIEGYGSSGRNDDTGYYNFDYTPFVFKSGLPSADDLEAFISDKAELLRWARPLNAESIARLITSSLKGEIDLKPGEHLKEGIVFTDEYNELITIPSFYSMASKWNNVDSAAYHEGVFKASEEEGVSCRFLNKLCGYRDKIWILEGVDQNQESYLTRD